MPSQKHLLISYDSSPASCQALKYCSLLFHEDEQVTFQLLHCLACSNSSVIPAPLDYNSSLLPEANPGKHQQNRAEASLRKGFNFLKSKGIPDNRIELSKVFNSTYKAQAIQLEAERLLSDCIVVARRGIGYIGEMVLGSVSATLFRNSHATPLWIIDGEVSSKNILVAVDGSIRSLRAVDHLAHIAKGRRDILIYLYHCSLFLAPEVVCSLDNFYQEWDHNWCDTYLSGNGCLFNGPRQLLLEAGIPEDNVIVLPETTTLQESTSIIAQAKKHQCGTIVIGRKGPNARKGFFGGVSNRMIRKSQNMAVWIVG